MITKEQIKAGQRFELASGDVFEITDVKPYEDNTPGARARLLPNTISNYRDTIEDIVEFLNEEGAKAI